MEKYIEILKKIEFFNGLNETDIISVLKCLKAKTVKYSKDETVYSEGDKIEEIGIVLSGTLHIIKYDYYGRENIISSFESGDLFAESAAFSGKQILPTNVISLTDSEIMFINRKLICKTCSNACSFHNLLIENLAAVLAEKNILLNQKLDYVTKRTTREKLLAYLFDRSKAAHNKKFQIPFNREQLANYLALDRSALSSELGKLRDEGILLFHKNEFELK